jgi:hypothetical protein
MAKVVDRDRGYLNLMRRLDGLNQRVVVVGILGEKASAAHGKRLTNVDVASIHEFGAPGAGIPERAPIRGAVDQNEQPIRELQRIGARGVVAGKISMDKALAILGESVVGMIKARIRQHIPPPNSPATIKRKGSSTPLIDTAQLLNSYSYEVRARA